MHRPAIKRLFVDVRGQGTFNRTDDFLEGWKVSVFGIEMSITFKPLLYFGLRRHGVVVPTIGLRRPGNFLR
jgi:hypothetical protein